MLGYLHEFKVLVDATDEPKFIDLCKKHDVTLLSCQQYMDNYAVRPHSGIEYQCRATGAEYEDFIKEAKNVSDIYITIIKS